MRKDFDLDRPMFSRELAEIYLLIDFVTASPSRELPKWVDDEIGPDLVARVSELAYPPAGRLEEVARQASLLIRIRNALHRTAAPATALTVAFTLLAAGEGASLRSHLKQRSRSTPDPSVYGLVLPTRASLAFMAFPSLGREAKRFQSLVAALICVILGLVLITTWLSWDVTAGNTALTAWTKAAIEAAKVAAAAPSGTTTSAPGAASLQAVEAARDLSLAEANLRQWLTPWQSVLGGSPGASCGAVACPAGYNVNDEWAAEILNVLGGNVLPSFYGLIGTGAALVRTVPAQIRDSLLSPRHFLQMVTQLTLGSVVGGCIGLFVTPAGAPSSGIFGSLPLSPSALAFVGGYGFETVFRALDSRIPQLFAGGKASSRRG
jgi:hypothetical protein